MRPGLLTITEAARELGINRKTLSKAVRAGQLDAVLINDRYYVSAEVVRRALGTANVTPVAPRPQIRFRGGR
jgi:excisionase family DNA binding protein